MLTGVNVEATATLARATGLQIIASGGVASLMDVERLRNAIRPQARTDIPFPGERRGSIEGVIIGQALYTGVVSLPEAIRAAQD